MRWMQGAKSPVVGNEGAIQMGFSIAVSTDEERTLVRDEIAAVDVKHRTDGIEQHSNAADTQRGFLGMIPNV